jgi:hypothetical protein
LQQESLGSRTDTKIVEHESLFQGQSSIYEEEKLANTLETGIMNLHANLKNLEGRYIDLANFYKQEFLSRPLSSIDESKEHARIEAVRQEKMRLESQLKGLILLQAKIDPSSDTVGHEVNVACGLLLQHFEADTISKGTIRSIFADL